MCYDLARRGLSAVNNPFEGGPFDILADYSGRLIRIQVKGTSSAYTAERVRGDKKWAVNAYQFHVNKSQLPFNDVVAFVAIDLQTVIYRTPAELVGNSTGIQFPPDVMRVGCDLSLTSMLAHLDNV